MGKVIYMWDIRTNGLVVALYIAYIISFYIYIYVIYALVQFIAPRFEYIESGIILGIKKKDKPRGDRPPIKLKIQKENIKIEPDTKREKESYTQAT